MLQRHDVGVAALTDSVTGTLELLNSHPGVLEHCDAKTLHRAARVLSHTGIFTEIERLVEQGLARSSTTEERIFYLKSAAIIAYQRADFARFERIESEILGLARAIGNLRWVDAALFNRALALDGLGRQHERLEMLEEAMRVCIELGDITALAIAQVSFAGALHSFAEYERAEQVLLEARAVFVTLDPTGHAIDCEAALVTLYLDWPRQYAPMLALKYARCAQDLAQSMDTRRYHLEVDCLLARALHANNQSLEALEHSSRAVRLVETLDLPTSRFDALWTHGLMLWANGQSAQALGFLTQAQAVAEGYDDRAATHRVGLDIDRFTNNLESAKDRLAWFERRQLNNFCNLTRHSFPVPNLNRSTGNTRASQRSTRGAGSNAPAPSRCAPADSGTQTSGVSGRAARSPHRRTPRNSETRTDRPLYRDSSEAQAAASLKDLAHQIRTAYGSELIITTTHGYALGVLRTDLEAYLETGDARVWHAPYLSGPEDGLRPSCKLICSNRPNAPSSINLRRHCGSDGFCSNRTRST